MLRYANAEHLPPLVVRHDGRLEELDALGERELRAVLERTGGGSRRDDIALVAVRVCSTGEARPGEPGKPAERRADTAAEPPRSDHGPGMHAPRHAGQSRGATDSGGSSNGDP
jgi:hypothetical protein